MVNKMGNYKSRIISQLDGIDKTELESAGGWWETSTGRIFGSCILLSLSTIGEEADKQIDELKEELESAREIISDLSRRSC